jgi:periplasmic copper chaperone A
MTPTILVVRVAIVAMILVGGSAAAHEYRRETLEIDHPWARATPQAVKNGAVYLEIRNIAPEPDRLVAISTPAADKAELHKTEREGDILRMREAPMLDIPANDSVLLRPGGLHIMLTGLKAPLKAGTEFPLTLRFERAGPIEVEIRVERGTPSHGPSAPSSSHGH